jgi:DNA-directed RNA polymerase subunit RPC12/RpoP
MEQTVIYHCQACGNEFIVKQGSRRRYCDACLAKRVLAGRPEADDSEKASSDESS